MPKWLGKRLEIPQGLFLLCRYILLITSIKLFVPQCQEKEHNQNRKHHRNGIKKFRRESLKGCYPKMIFFQVYNILSGIWKQLCSSIVNNIVLYIIYIYTIKKWILWLERENFYNKEYVFMKTNLVIFTFSKGQFHKVHL